jgi:hypothetical protein
MRDTANQGNDEPSRSTPDSSPNGELGELRDPQVSLDTPNTQASAVPSDKSVAADEERVGVEMVEVALGQRKTGQVPYYIGM